MLLRAELVSKSFGLKDVLKSVSIQINNGDRLGLIGRNGVGKTTLLKVFMGQLKPDTGELDVRTNRIGYLSQSPTLDPNKTVNEIVGKPYGSLASLINRIDELESLMASNSINNGVVPNEIITEYARLQEEFGSTGGHAVSSKARNALVKVGLPKDIVERKISKLSGGELTKVMLARVLVQAEKADILYLDEPTSHLDMGTMDWLENYLKKIRAGMVIVSHDRYFLDKVVTQIIELENGFLQHYNGNYTQFIKKKTLEFEKQKKTYKKYQTEKERQKKIAEEQYSRLSFGTIHKTRIKMMERMKVIDKPQKKEDLKVKIEAVKKSGKNVIIAKNLVVKRGKSIILNGLNLDIEVGDKIGIFGPNGSGKTTLIKTFLSEIPFDGDLWVAPGADTGYFSQGHDQLDNSITPEQQLLNVLGKNERLKVRNLLARFLLTGRDVIRPISTLSGGERARVALALLIAKRHNFLIMDEPTNYLDIPARHAVESALVEYPGSILIITHDRYFLDSVCNKVGELKDGKLTVYPCTYSELKDRNVIYEENTFKVISGFKNWITKKKFKAGEQIVIATNEMESYKWALEKGLLKKINVSKVKKK